MKFVLMHKGRRLEETTTVEECAEKAVAGITMLNLLGVRGVELVVWKEWATGRRQRIRAFYTQPTGTQRLVQIDVGNVQEEL